VRKFAVMLLLAASCAEAPKNTEIARKAFEDWAKVASAGDAEKTLSGFTDAFKSEWLYDRFKLGDPITRKWRGELTGEPRTRLDLWLGIAAKQGNGRQSPLPSLVLEDPSFAPMFRECFLIDAQNIKSMFARMEIAQVYADDQGVTVAVRSGPGAPVEMYEMVYEHTGWKINNYRPPLNGGR
jgi:hypothetical protein